MFGIVTRLIKFSLNLLTKIIELPYHLVEFALVVWGAVVVGAVGGGIVFLFCMWLNLDPYLVALPWAVGLGLLQLGRNLHAVYVRGESIG